MKKASHPCSLGLVPSSAWRRGLYEHLSGGGSRWQRRLERRNSLSALGEYNEEVHFPRGVGFHSGRWRYAAMTVSFARLRLSTFVPSRVHFSTL
jgi:hypothetical protein